MKHGESEDKQEGSATFDSSSSRCADSLGVLYSHGNIAVMGGEMFRGLTA
jgi:hypothetical protein